MFPTWQPPNNCSTGPQPGLLAFMKWFVEEYGDEGGYNLGIYNCRPVRGGKTLSLHGEGRAADLGFPVGDKDGDDCLKRLLDNVGDLGIQCIIYERRIYSAKSPAGRPYTGVNPHLDHLHVEFSWEGARELNYATVVDVMTPGLPRVVRGTRDLFIGAVGTDVRFVQRKVGADKDGHFGEKTKEAVRKFEEKHVKKYPRLKADGVVGRLTWKVLGVKPKY